MERRIDGGGLPDGVVRLLLESWLVALATERLGFSQFGSAGFKTPRPLRLGEEGKQFFHVTDHGDSLTVDRVDGVEESVVAGIVDDALAKVAARDLGGTLAYSTEATVDAVEKLHHSVQQDGQAAQRRSERGRTLPNLALV